MRDQAGNPISYGNIEGSSPKKLPSRSNGPISADLNTGDIEGSQANTRGKGTFAKRTKGTIKDNIGVQDIEGARPGTVQVGLRSKRVTNPIMPEYQALGRTQEGLRQDVVYAEPWKEMPMKKTNTRTKPEWKRSNVIPAIEEKKVEVKIDMQQSNAALAEDVHLIINW
eukprot:TRINITY_DN8951_c0_g1_i3.p1 TRINITY_DN8951_c0_g1~~TRINITY_DN8951_c0_g1_i3.p1  ORF type:complete len:168 (-),score=28.10 TRINITY_DN8951_c0_g1_i3:582-1085(-)